MLCSDSVGTRKSRALTSYSTEDDLSWTRPIARGGIWLFLFDLICSGDHLKFEMIELTALSVLILCV